MMACTVTTWLFQLLLLAHQCYHMAVVIVAFTFITFSQAATVGGVDLCYGRYDDHGYRLFDPDHHHYPGRDYNNLYWSIGEV